jgi:hypothetical protein
MLRYQFDELRTLARLQIPKLRVAKALALLRVKRIYVMEFAAATPASRDQQFRCLFAIQMPGQ